MSSLTPQQSHELNDLSPDERHSYFQFRRRMNHANAMQAARDSIRERDARRMGGAQ